MKSKLYKLLCIFSAASIGMAFSPYCTAGYDDYVDDGGFSDEPNGKMSTVYAYVMNDYFNTYGVISDEYPQGNVITDPEELPAGVIYGDVVNFDNNEDPYLVIYIIEGGYRIAGCHIWSYNEETEKAKRIAILEKDYSEITDGYGKFELGWNDDKRFIVYSEYQNDEPVREDYYTVIDNEAFQYVSSPESVSRSSVMHFNAAEFAPDINVSDYNKQLGEFFDSLKDSASDSVSYADISQRITLSDEQGIEDAVSDALALGNFDINSFKDESEYEAALAKKDNEDKFYLISSIHSLGNEMYYIFFSTDRSFYNYALFRRSENNSYQVLKVSTDCIPLSDRELKQTVDEYEKNPFLIKKANDPLRIMPEQKDVNAPVERDAKPRFDLAEKLNLPRLNIEKRIERRYRIPIACIGGGISIALLTLLWVYVYGTEEE